MGGEKKWVYLSFILATLTCAWVLKQALGLVVSYANLPNPMVMGVVPATTLVAVGSMALTGYFYFRRPLVQAFSMEVLQELKKVTWPPRKNAYLSTVVVVIAVFIAATILFLFDMLCTKLVELVV